MALRFQPHSPSLIQTTPKPSSSHPLRPLSLCCFLSAFRRLSFPPLSSPSVALRVPLLSPSYEQHLVSSVLSTHSGEVHTIVLSLATSALHLLQHTSKRSILITPTRSAFVSQLHALAPRLELRSPDWVFDSVEGSLRESLEIIYKPLPLCELRDLRSVRAKIESDRKEECERIARCVGILVVGEGSEVVLTEREWEEGRKEKGVRFAWVLDCIQEGRVLPIQRYLCGWRVC